MTEIIVLKQFFENTLFLHCFLNNLFYKFTHPSPQKSDIHGSQLHVPIILHERVRSSKLMIREGFYPNTERFGQVLGVFCRTGCVCEGFQVVGLMICSGISVSFNVWSMLVSCFFFRSGDPKKAVDLFNKMVKIGCSPNLSSDVY